MTHLNASALYELAAPSTPDHVRSVIVKGLQRGKSFHADDIKDMVRRSGRPSNEAGQSPDVNGPTKAADAKASPSDVEPSSEVPQAIMLPGAQSGQKIAPDEPFEEPTQDERFVAEEPEDPAPADTTIADQIRLQRQQRIVTLIVEGLGEREPELLNMLSEGSWDQSTLFQHLMEKLEERQIQYRKPGT